jgi:uncharacterized membrane protein YphA (DoxX/SURF4 family)
MGTLTTASAVMEAVVNRVGQPMKPYLTHIGRFLLVVTFLEDAVRVLMQWNDQLHYLQHYRRLPLILGNLFLLYNVLAMLTGSALALFNCQPLMALALLASVMVIQTVGYGLLGNWGFMLRNFALLGGLLMMVFDADNNDPKAVQSRRMPLLPRLTDVEKGTYLALAGRVLLICLTGSLLYNGILEPRHGQLRSAGSLLYLARVLAFAAAFVSSVLVAIGFKARHSATFLMALMSVFNVALNAWWTYGPGTPERDFLRYDFFQTLSIIGGFLLLVHGGPGTLSYDQHLKTKAF